jgi:plastocyanin
MLVASVLVIVVAAGALSYFVFASMTRSPPPNRTTATTSSLSTATAVSSSSLTASTVQSTSSSVTTFHSTTATSSQSTTGTTSTTSSTSGFVLPAGSSEVVIPQGIQDANAKQQNITFDPYNLKVVIGVNNTVYFYDADSQDRLGHVIESNSWPSSAQPFAFDILPGQDANVTLTVPGTYTYNCEWHPVWMTGTIIVLSG